MCVVWTDRQTDFGKGERGKRGETRERQAREGRGYQNVPAFCLKTNVTGAYQIGQ